jgi:hypothetical protein
LVPVNSDILTAVLAEIDTPHTIFSHCPEIGRLLHFLAVVATMRDEVSPPKEQAMISQTVGRTQEVGASQPALATTESATAEAARILILALPKSGTTILFQILKESMAEDTVCLFEPAACQPEAFRLSGSRSLLAKVLIAKPSDSEHFSPAACAAYNKRIFLRRDPRDLLVSLLLYGTYESAITSDFWRFAQFVSALRAKEADPTSISFLDLLKLETYLAHHNDGSLLTDFEQFLRTAQFSLEVVGSHGDGLFHLKYEELVDRRLESVEKYLGFPLAQAGQVDRQYDRVARTKGYGDWRNWFLPEDIAFFRPRLAAYMRATGYDDEWDLAEKPIVSPHNASGYLMRLADERGSFRAIDCGNDAFPPQNNILRDPSLDRRPHLIPNVQPKAREVYPGRGAEIRDPHVETVDGQRVNVLSPGDRYIYKYEVVFTRPMRKVSCWMALVDEQNNTIVSNGTSRHFGEYESIVEGCRLCVEFEYVCQQCPGLYSLNAGVMTAEAGAAEYAHRIVGAVLIIVRLARAELAAGPPRVSFQKGSHCSS